MIPVPESFQTLFFQVLKKEVPITDFEQWVYDTPELEEILTEADYLGLISLNYKSKEVFSLLEEIIGKHVDFVKFETIYLRKLLQQIIDKTSDVTDVLIECYHLYCHGYNFLEKIGFEGLSLLMSLEDGNETEVLNSLYPGVAKEAQKIADRLDSQQILLLPETNEFGRHLYTMNLKIMKIIIAGGSGYLGQVLAQDLAEKGYQVVILSRGTERVLGDISFKNWDGETLGDWAAEFENAEAVINLAGKSVNCRYNERNKAEIYRSRLLSTKVVGAAILQCKNPPKVWIQSASSTIYRHAEDRPMDELTGEIGTGFSIDVCRQWEKTFNDIPTPHTRKVLLRIAIVLGKSGGALPPLLRLTRWGLGGQQGNGNQRVSWLHDEDFCRVIEFALKNEQVSGVYNVATPNAVTNAELMKTLRQVCKIPFGLPTPVWLLTIGAALIQTEPELLLKSRWVIPTKLSQAGFTFKYPQLKMALENTI